MKLKLRKLILVCFLLGLLLTSCDSRASCAMQAVAGGSQYCQELAKWRAHSAPHPGPGHGAAIPIWTTFQYRAGSDGNQRFARFPYPNR